jgi:hypothetical protein
VSFDLIITEVILFCSTGLFIYWIKRALLILSRSKEEIDRVLESDLWWGQRFWLVLRTLFNPSSQLLSV